MNKTSAIFQSINPMRDAAITRAVERWKTQMIINVSSLGKLFNQFPTRKLKK